MIAAIEPSDAVWLAIIGVVTMAMKEYFDRQRAREAAAAALEVAKVAKATAQEAAEEAREVKKVLVGESVKQDDRAVKQEERLESMAKTGEKALRYANSAMEEQMRLLAETARAKADLRNDPVDLAAAKVAEEAYERHRKEQESITKDAKESKDANAKDVKSAIQQGLKQDIAELPEKTAQRVVEKLDEGELKEHEEREP